MTAAFLISLVGLGVLGAFVSGLLGVGGAIVMIPLLLYAPPLLGVGELDPRSVTGITIAQVFVAASSGMLAHRRRRLVHADLAVWGGLSMAAGSLAGAIASHAVPARTLLLVFALMATAAMGLMLLPKHVLERAEATATARTRFSRVRIVLVGGSVGVAAGLVGAGGAFMLVPLLLVVVGVPIRVTIGSSLAITALSSLAGFVGKLATGQVPYAAAVAVAIGAVPGAQLGAALSLRVPGERLRLMLMVVIAISAMRVWLDVLRP